MGDFSGISVESCLIPVVFFAQGAEGNFCLAFRDEPHFSGRRQGMVACLKPRLMNYAGFIGIIQQAVREFPPGCLA